MVQILQGAAADGPVLQADGEGLSGPRGRGEHGEGEDAELLRDRAALQGQQRHLPLVHLGVGHTAHPGGHCGPVAHLGEGSFRILCQKKIQIFFIYWLN